MEVDAKKPKNITPYIPFKTFIGFIDNLKTHAVPPIIDHSLLQSMSGSMRGQLLSSLRYLNLIDSNNHVIETLKSIVTSYKTDAWQMVLHEILQEAYHDVVGEVKLDHGTSQQLIEAFKKNGNVDGQMLDKAVRFYLSALDECGIKYSPYFKAKKPRKQSQRKKKPSQKSKSDESPESEKPFEDDFHEGANFRIPVPGKTDVVIFLPDNIDQHDWEMVKTMLDAYVGRLAKAEGGEM